MLLQTGKRRTTPERQTCIGWLSEPVQIALTTTPVWLSQYLEPISGRTVVIIHNESTTTSAFWSSHTSGMAATKSLREILPRETISIDVSEEVDIALLGGGSINVTVAQGG